MSTRPGYHLVTAPLNGDWEQCTALEFFRQINDGEEIPEWVTVTGLDELLLHVDNSDRAEVIRFLNRLLTRTRPGSPLAVQFVLDGTLAKDERVYIEPAASPDTRLYIDALFRDQPEQQDANHFWSERA